MEEGPTPWLLVLNSMLCPNLTSTKAPERRNQTTHIPLHRQKLSDGISELSVMGWEMNVETLLNVKSYVNEGKSPHHQLLSITGKHSQKQHMKIILKQNICT